MDIKGIVNSVDWKGIALRHCEKAAIAIVSCLLVLFAVKSVNKTMTARKVAPEEIAQRANDLETRIRSSTWDDTRAASEGIVNPPFEDKIGELKRGIDTSQKKFAKPWFPFHDFGGILRQQPEIHSPYDLLAFADRGAISLYQMDAKGKIVEVKATPAPAQPLKKKAVEEDDDEAGKKPGNKKTPKTNPAKTPPKGKTPGSGNNLADQYKGKSGSGMMGGGMMGGGMMGGGMMGGGNMMMGGGPRGGPGAGTGGGDEIGGEGGSNLIASQKDPGAGNVRRPAAERNRFAKAPAAAPDPNKPGVAGAVGKVAAPAMRKVEDIYGVRWVVVTALFPHLEQVQLYNEALHTRELGQPDEPPEYERLKVERRHLKSDGTFSDWVSFDNNKAFSKMLKRVPATEDRRRRMPEDADLRSANAIFDNLIMPLPILEAGGWNAIDREAAVEAAQKAGGNVVADQGDLPDEGDETGGGMGGGIGNNPQGGGGVGANLGATSGPTGLGGPAGIGGGPAGGGMGAGPSNPSGFYSGGGQDQRSGAPNLGGDPRGQGGAGAGGGMGMGGQGAGAQPGGNRKAAPSGQPKAGTAAAPKVVAQKTNAEFIQVRFIDYAVDPEHTYQYRFKVVVKNPNHNHNTAADPAFKKEKELESKDWSDPSPPVFVRADTEYYVLERVKQREEAKLQVHIWTENYGDWSVNNFPVKPGDPIGLKVKEYTMVNWDGQAEKKEFDFATDELLIDVSGGQKQFMFTVDGKESVYNETLPAEILVVDRLGDLATRNEDLDKNDRVRKDREKYLEDLKKSATVPEKKSAASKTEGTDKTFDDTPARKSGSGAKE